MPNDRDQRRDIQGLLQQLSIGLSAYRLFPGDTEQVAFVGAVERIRAAAERALQHGTVLVEVHGPRFLLKDQDPLPEDETQARLAKACFERRGERIRVRALPEASELGTFYEALMRTPQEVEEAGGLDKILRDAGLTSIAVSEVELQPMDAAVLAGLSAEQAQLWEQLQHGDVLAPLVEEEAEANEEARSIYGRFKDLVASLPTELAEDPDLYRRLHSSVEQLPPDVRQALTARMVQASEDDPLSDRMLTAMTDVEMARSLVELARDSKRDPVTLARDIVAKGIRRSDSIVKMTAAMAEEGATAEPPDAEKGSGGPALPAFISTLPAQALQRPGDAAASVPLPTTSERQAVVSRAVTDILSLQVHSEDRGELDTLRLEFPLALAESRVIALATLRDYLAVEHDMDRLETVLEIWSEAVRERLQQKDADGAAELVKLATTSLSGDEERRALGATYLRRVLDAGLITSLLTGDQDPSSLRSLLAPLGPSALDGLLDALGDEQDRVRRALLIAVLTDLCGEYRELVVERLNDPRWFVARNAVTILHRAGVDRDDVPWLERAIRHDHPAVRREVIEPLAVALGADSVPLLGRMASDTDPPVAHLAVGTLGSMVSPRAVLTLVELARSSRDWKLRRRAIEMLGGHPAPTALEALQTLGSWRAQPRLPRSLRRTAKKLAKERRRQG